MNGIFKGFGVEAIYFSKKLRWVFGKKKK